MRTILTGLLMMALLYSGAAHGACGGDCNGDGSVAINELILGVNVALGSAAPGACGSLDGNGDGSVSISELIGAVGSALAGCPDPNAPTRTPTPTRVPSAPPTATRQPTQTRPTPGPGCEGGYFVVEFAEPTADVNSYYGLSGPVELTDVTGVILTVGPTSAWNGFGANLISCPISIDRVIRRLAFTFNIMPAPFAAGATYQLNDTVGLAQPTHWVDYVEQPPTNPFAIRQWRSHSGTLTVDAIEGDVVTFHLEAEMWPNQNATGRFRMTARGTIDAVERRN